RAGEGVGAGVVDAVVVGVAEGRDGGPVLGGLLKRAADEVRGLIDTEGGGRVEEGRRGEGLGRGDPVLERPEGEAGLVAGSSRRGRRCRGRRRRCCWCRGRPRRWSRSWRPPEACRG